MARKEKFNLRKVKNPKGNQPKLKGIVEINGLYYDVAGWDNDYNDSEMNFTLERVTAESMKKNPQLKKEFDKLSK